MSVFNRPPDCEPYESGAISYTSLYLCLSVDFLTHIVLPNDVYNDIQMKSKILNAQHGIQLCFMKMHLNSLLFYEVVTSVRKIIIRRVLCKIDEVHSCLKKS